MSVTPRSSWIVALALSVLAVAAPGASAQSPSQAGYGETPVVALPRSAAARADVDPNAGSGRLAAADATGRTPTHGAPPVAAAAAAAAAQSFAPAAAPGADGFGASGERLPFTGMDLAVIALIAVALLACGVGLRRATGAL
jgi:pyruvate/2-oxoglutarate dehydrogenase complex dihydrolipoamide acyltransferase (E2) component